jgi:hypothetical protein
MSDVAVFVSVAADELSASGQLPGDLRSLRNYPKSDERVVHCEVISDAALPEKTSNALSMAGATLTVLPASTEPVAALTGGLMARLHEFISAYAQVDHMLLAGAEVERLAPAALFLRRAGYRVTIIGTDKTRLDTVKSACDATAVWGAGRSNSRESRSRESRESQTSKLDPYEVLVDEITKARKKGNRVLLTSLKQRIRKRIRRFDETRLKDQDGKPMRQFKDFILDAVNRGLIQLVERGNASHVLLPDEEIPEDDDLDDVDTEDSDDTEFEDDESGDPLLDGVDMPGEEADAEPADLPELREKDFKVDLVNEDAPAPTGEFMTFLDNFIPKEGLALGELLHTLGKEQEAGNLELTNRELKKQLQNAFYNELLEAVNEDEPARYVVVDDWKDIIDFL